MSSPPAPLAPRDVGGQPSLVGVEILHPRVAEALRGMSGAARLRLAHEEWRLVRERLTVFLAGRHPEWEANDVRREVARRLFGGSR